MSLHGPNDYTAIDAAILASIRAGRPTFRMMCANEQLAALCKGVQAKDWDRVIDRRLQALKRHGRIAYASGIWVVKS